MITLGVAGFLCGFIGPLYLSPQSNQGPMFGLFFSGPGGAILGAVIGAALSFAGATARTSNRALGVSAALMAIGTLYACIPEPKRLADLVEGEVRSCVDPESLKAAAVQREDEIDAAHRYQPKKPWNVRFDEMVREKPGVVIDFQARRIRPVFEGRAAWDSGKLTAGAWKPVDEAATYYAAGFDCAALATAKTAKLALVGGTGGWPPYDIAQLLQLRLATAVPGDYARFITQ